MWRVDSSAGTAPRLHHECKLYFEIKIMYHGGLQHQNDDYTMSVNYVSIPGEYYIRTF